MIPRTKLRTDVGPAGEQPAQQVDHPKYKKRALPNRVRRDVCRRYGAKPGMRIDVQCHYCDHVGFIDWWEHYPYWPTLSLEFDHYIPEVAGGSSEAENIVLACRRCNRSKKDRIPTEPLVLRVSA